MIVLRLQYLAACEKQHRIPVWIDSPRTGISVIDEYHVEHIFSQSTGHSSEHN